MPLAPMLLTFTSVFFRASITGFQLQNISLANILFKKVLFIKAVVGANEGLLFADRLPVEFLRIWRKHIV